MEIQKAEMDSMSELAFVRRQGLAWPHSTDVVSMDCQLFPGEIRSIHAG